MEGLALGSRLPSYRDVEVSAWASGHSTPSFAAALQQTTLKDGFAADEGAKESSMSESSSSDPRLLDLSPECKSSTTSTMSSSAASRDIID